LLRMRLGKLNRDFERVGPLERRHQWFSRA
jgi:hypothetical protein